MKQTKSLCRKTLSVDEAVNLGVIQEINRLLLHPAGLHMEISPRQRLFGGEDIVVTLDDWRDSDDGVYFRADNPPITERAESFAALSSDKAVNRLFALGCVVEPTVRMAELENTSDLLKISLRADHCSSEQ